MEIERWLKGEGEKFFKKIKIKERDIILDFGCGQGTYTIPAAKVVGKEGKVYALDRDENDLNRLIQRTKLMNLENIEIIKTSGELKIPIKDESMDVVLLYDVLHNYYFSLSERRQLLREVYRVLKSQALLSVYPKHMELEAITKEIENVNFYLEDKYFKTLIHENRYTEGYILNFRKADKKINF